MEAGEIYYGRKKISFIKSQELFIRKTERRGK
jgi:hypothetical protein